MSAKQKICEGFGFTSGQLCVSSIRANSKSYLFQCCFVLVIILLNADILISVTPWAVISYLLSVLKNTVHMFACVGIISKKYELFFYKQLDWQLVQHLVSSWSMSVKMQTGLRTKKRTVGLLFIRKMRSKKFVNMYLYKKNHSFKC